MVCPKCKGTDLKIQMVEVGQKTKGKGASGLSKLGRATMQVSTLGMYGLVAGKSKGKEKTTTVNEKRAVCQSCGHDWKVK